MVEQCRAKRGEVRCQRYKGHDGHHRAETGGHWDDPTIVDWPAEVSR